MLIKLSSNATSYVQHSEKQEKTALTFRDKVILDRVIIGLIYITAITATILFG